MRDLYAALFELDKGLSERFTTIQDSINGLHDRLTAHERNHSSEQAVVSREVKLDAKKAGIAGLLAAVVAGVVETLRRVG